MTHFMFLIDSKCGHLHLMTLKEVEHVYSATKEL